MTKRQKREIFERLQDVPITQGLYKSYTRPPYEEPTQDEWKRLYGEGWTDMPLFWLMFGIPRKRGVK